MITQTAEYALRAGVYLADQQRARTTSTIAEKMQVPPGYLAKVMQGVTKAGLVHAQRGLHGGDVLTRLADDLTILEVSNAVQPIRRYHECPLGLHGRNLCPPHCKLDDAAKSSEETFGQTNVAEFCHHEGRQRQAIWSISKRCGEFAEGQRPNPNLHSALVI